MSLFVCLCVFERTFAVLNNFRASNICHIKTMKSIDDCVLQTIKIEIKNRTI